MTKQVQSKQQNKQQTKQQQQPTLSKAEMIKKIKEEQEKAKLREEETSEEDSEMEDEEEDSEMDNEEEEDSEVDDASDDSEMDVDEEESDMENEFHFGSFWGLYVHPKKMYTHSVDTEFCVTMAALPYEIEPKAGRTTLYVRVGEVEEFALCSLTPGKLEQQAMQHQFAVGETVSFFVRGDCPIHLTGFYTPSSHEHDHCGDDEEDYSDVESDEELDSDMYGLSEEEDESDDDENRIQEIEEEAPELIKADTVQLGQKREAAEPVVEVKKVKLEEKANKTPAKESVKSETTKVQQTPSKEANKPETPKVQQTPAKEANKETKVQQTPAKEKPQTPADKTPAKEKPTDSDATPKAAANANPAKTPVNKTLPSGLKMEDKKVGDGMKAKAGKRVSVRYIGRLASNNKVFDSNTQGKPFTFTLGKGEVIKGWDIGIEGMSVGGERKLTIPSSLAYGKEGAGSDIPKNADLIFEVKLLEVK